MRLKITVDEEEIRELVAAKIKDEGFKVQPGDIVISHPDDGPVEAWVDVDASKVHPVPN
jgi:hypothetical protein